MKSMQSKSTLDVTIELSNEGGKGVFVISKRGPKIPQKTTLDKSPRPDQEFDLFDSDDYEDSDTDADQDFRFFDSGSDTDPDDQCDRNVEILEKILEIDPDTTCALEDGDEELNKYNQPKEGVLCEDKKNIFMHDFLETFGLITWETVQQKFVATFPEEPNLKDIEHLTMLSQIATTPAQKVCILLALVTSQIDIVACGHMPVPIWKDCAQNFIAIIDILNDNFNIVLVDLFSSRDPKETKKGPNYEGKIELVGNLAKLLKTIYFNFFWTLKCVKPHSLVYREMIRSIPLFYLLLHKVHGYLDKIGDYENAAHAARIQMELVYYKPKSDYTDMREAAEDPSVFPENCSRLMDELGSYILKYGTEKNKIYAMLFDVYHQAIMDEFSAAESRFLKTRLLVEDEPMDNLTRVYFNRAMAQLGLCAYRGGLKEEAHHYLSELYKCGSVMELLGQGFSSGVSHAKTPLQEKVKRLKMLPCHLHLDSQLLDAVYTQLCA